MEYDRKKQIKEIEIDNEEITYMLRNYNINDLTDLEIQEVYIGLSKAWLILQKIVRTGEFK